MLWQKDCLIDQEEFEDEFELLVLDNEKDKQRKIELESELADTHREAQNMRNQLDSVQERNPKILIYQGMEDFKPQIASDILRTADSHNCIYIPIWLWGIDKENKISNLNERIPYKYEVIFLACSKVKCTRFSAIMRIMTLATSTTDT